jgi:hypothetical protein
VNKREKKYMDCLCVLSYVSNGIIVTNTTSRRQIKVGKKYRFFSRSVTHDLCLKIVSLRSFYQVKRGISTEREIVFPSKAIVI